MNKFMYTFKIINVEPAHSQVDNNHFIDVEVEIYKGEEFSQTRRFGFALGTDKKTILAELEKVCSALASDDATAEASRGLMEGLAGVEALKSELVK